MSNWDRFASWDNKAPQENNIDMQFNDIKKNLSNTYARDDINDKLNQRGYTPCSYPMNINKSENNNNYKDEYNKYFGRLDYESSFKKINNKTIKNISKKFKRDFNFSLPRNVFFIPKKINF